MKTNILIIALFLSVFFVADHTHASAVVRSGNAVTLSGDQETAGNFYAAAANNVTVSGVIGGDASLVSSKVTVNGKVASDTLAIGWGVDVYGETGGDLRVVGGEVTVGGKIKGDLMVVGYNLNVLSTAEIEGDVIFYGQTATIAGKVKKDVVGRYATLRIDGEVGKDINVTATMLTLGDAAKVAGNVQYASDAPLIRASGAAVGGEVVKNSGDPIEVESTLRLIVEGALILLFAVLTWFLLLRRSLEDLVLHATTRYVRSAIIGLAIVLVMPFLSGLLIISQLGVVLGVTLFVLYTLMVILALIGLVAVAGGFIRVLVKGKTFSILWILSGAAMLGALALVPVLFVAIFTGLFIITLGALGERMYTIAK